MSLLQDAANIVIARQSAVWPKKNPQSALSRDAVVCELASQIQYAIENHPILRKLVLPQETAEGDSTERGLFEKIELEIEGRLGVILEPHSDARLQLPTACEALLRDKDNSNFPYAFAAGISKSQFESFGNLFGSDFTVPPPFSDNVVSSFGETGRTPASESTEISSGETSKKEKDRKANRHPGNSEPWTRAHEIQTLDLFHELTPELLGRDKLLNAMSGNRNQTQSLRTSLCPTSGEFMEAITKQNQVVLNIYSGQDTHQDDVSALAHEALADDVQKAIDFRIAVNYEYSVPKTVASAIRSQCTQVHQRQRSRVSYPLFGIYRVDFTKVDNDGGQTSKQRKKDSGKQTSYEVEVEINQNILLFHLKQKLAKKENKFDLIIANFVNLLRDWCSRMNQSLFIPRDEPKTGPAELADLTECVPSNSVIDRYLRYVSPVAPIIGDYLFRAVAPARHTAHQADTTGRVVPLSATDVALSVRQELTESEKKKLQKRALLVE